MSERARVGLIDGCPPLRRRGPNVWVVRFGARFSVTEEGTRIHLVPPIPQRAAIVLAQAIARANRSELIVQSRLGRIRIRDSSSCPPVHLSTCPPHQPARG
jgi:hypothetical protein